MFPAHLAMMFRVPRITWYKNVVAEIQTSRNARKHTDMEMRFSSEAQPHCRFLGRCAGVGFGVAMRAIRLAKRYETYGFTTVATF